MRVQSLGHKDSLEEGMATPIFLPGKFHRQRGLACYSLLLHTQSDMTEVT